LMKEQYSHKYFTHTDPTQMKIIKRSPLMKKQYSHKYFTHTDLTQMKVIKRRVLMKEQYLTNILHILRLLK
jgi:hypothetical protein